jgi:5'-phosphate synthase pdxT subunit
VLALQGDVREHLDSLGASGVEAVTVRTAAELDKVDALVLPGGESTTMGRLLHVFGLREPLLERVAAGMPTLSTCAGTILLSKRIQDGHTDQRSLQALDIDTRRNGYGRQVDSFETDISISGLEGPPFRAVFIRAPVITRCGESVEVLASLDGAPVAVRQGAHLALTFHPELTGDARLHRLFADSVRARRVAAR